MLDVVRDRDPVAIDVATAADATSVISKLGQQVLPLHIKRPEWNFHLTTTYHHIYCNNDLLESPLVALVYV